MPGRGATAWLAAVWCLLLAHSAAGLPSHSSTHPSQTLSRMQGPAIRRPFAAASSGELRATYPEISRADTTCAPALDLGTCRGGGGEAESDLRQEHQHPSASSLGAVSAAGARQGLPLPSFPSGEILANGEYRVEKNLFESEAVARRLIQENFFFKTAGSVMNPLNWLSMARSLLARQPQRTIGLRRFIQDAGKGPMVMIDGADDLATALQGSGLPQQLQFALQGSGLPQQLQFALQAFLLYPLVLPVVYMGFRGAAGDQEENHEEALETMGEVEELKQDLMQTFSRVAEDLEPKVQATIEERLAHWKWHQARDRAEEHIFDSDSDDSSDAPAAPPHTPPQRNDGIQQPGATERRVDTSPRCTDASQRHCAHTPLPYLAKSQGENGARTES
ncbi:hypothetical protein T484DRAFT_1905634, partial [Baffinella frigidus]